MTICSFWGHKNVFDVNLYARLKDALNELVRDGDGVDFWFTDTGSDWLFESSFLNLCFTAAWEVRQHSRGKRVAITLVVPGAAREALEQRLSDCVASGPPCLIDRVLVAPIADAPRGGALADWVRRRSDCLVSYLYDDLFDGDRGALEAAVRQGKRVFSLTSAGTEAQILQDAESLVAQERYIFKKLRSGKSLEEIGSALNLSPSEMRGKLQSTGKTLRGQASVRVKSLQRSMDGARGRTCCILALGAPTSSALAAFAQRLAFLTPRYNIAQVHILGECCDSRYIAALHRRPVQRRERYVAITHLPQRARLAPDEWAALRARYCPPCNDVENIDTHTQNPREQLLIAMRRLIERSDFCICNLSASPCAREIRSYAAAPGAAKLLDAGNTALPPVTRAG